MNFYLKLKNIHLLIFIIIFSNSVFADKDIIQEYTMLLEDIKNYECFGYKGILVDCFANNDYINKQGFLMETGNENDFAISGKGFFKVFDENSKKYYYTRNGQFSKKNGTYYTVYGYKVISKIKFGENDKLTCDLYLPINLDDIKRRGEYFIFDNVTKINSKIMLQRYLEDSTVVMYTTVTRMIFILENLKNSKVKDLELIELKQHILKDILSNLLNEAMNASIKTHLYQYIDFSFPKITRITKDNMSFIHNQRNKMYQANRISAP